MNLTELTKKSTSDEDMAWVYKLIKDAYDKGDRELVLDDQELTLDQLTHLRDVKGYTVSSNMGEDRISGW